MVPRWRTAGSPIRPASLASTGMVCCTTGESLTSWCLVMGADGKRAAALLDAGEALDQSHLDDLRRFFASRSFMVGSSV